MNYTLHLGDCLEVMRTMEAGSVQTCVTSPLLKVFSTDVFAAMHPMVAQAAEGNEVIDVKAQGWIARPGLDVMGAKTTCARMGRIATGAAVVVSLVNRSDNFFPFAGSIQALTFGRAAILEVGICFARSARHGIRFTRLSPMLCFADSRHVSAWYTKLPQKMKNVGISNAKLLRNVGGWPLKIHIFMCQPFFGLIWLFRFISERIIGIPSQLACWYSVADNPLVDLFGIAVNQLRYRSATQFLNKILLPQPRFVNWLLGFLPFAFAFDRTETGNLSPASPHLSTALFTH